MGRENGGEFMGLSDFQLSPSLLTFPCEGSSKRDPDQQSEGGEVGGGGSLDDV